MVNYSKILLARSRDVSKHHHLSQSSVVFYLSGIAAWVSTARDACLIFCIVKNGSRSCWFHN